MEVITWTFNMDEASEQLTASEQHWLYKAHVAHSFLTKKERKEQI